MLETGDGTTTKNDNEVATILSDYFCTVFTMENPESMPPINFRSSLTVFDKLIVTPEEVYSQLCRLKTKKSASPDNCHPYVLFGVCSGLVLPLTLLFNKSLEESTLPNSWKDANVTPIFKQGCRTKPSKYRLVSLTSVISKMLEAIIKTHLMEHLESNSLLSDVQYGFCSGRSCELQLLRVVNHWTDCFDAGKDIDILHVPGSPESL